VSPAAWLVAGHRECRRGARAPGRGSLMPAPARTGAR